MQFNSSVLRSETCESALLELLVLIKVAENLAIQSTETFEPQLHLNFDAYTGIASFSGNIKFDFNLDPSNRSIIFDCQEYLP